MNDKLNPPNKQYLIDMRKTIAKLDRKAAKRDNRQRKESRQKQRKQRILDTFTDASGQEYAIMQDGSHRKLY